MVLRIALALAATLSLAMWQSDGCGYTPDPLKGEGEPCTRSSECQSTLACRGGVCMREGFDAGDPTLDAGGEDSGTDAGEAAGDGAVGDGGADASMDAEAPEAGLMDGGDGDGGADASTDASMM